ncbi:MAG: TonB-dependent receptor [Cyclobacteriaceae bacterium]|nr:TonB-dependent receptor [Cyclobacteriaceae bacterium]
MQKALLSLVALILSAGVAFSQGSIAGKITDEKTGEAIIGGSVLVQGTSIGTSTDIEGNFLIGSVPAGTYSLQITYVGYQNTIVPNVVVENGKRITIDAKISDATSQLEEVVITGTRSVDNDFSIVREIRESKLVVTGISAEMITRSPDRDAAEVVKRVPGVTIMDGKYIVIRGLSERYNVTLLHGAYAPSMEADKRSFAFDIIPSAQIDQLLVFKSPSPELPGDFAGGAVKITTKSIPDESSITVGYSLGYRAGTSFNDFYRGKRSGSQLIGLNGGANDLPSGFPSYVTSSLPQGELDNAALSLNNNWTPEKTSAFLDQSASVTGAFKFNAGKVQIGNITAINWSNTFTRYDVQRGAFNNYDEINNKPDPLYSYKDDQNNQNTRAGILFNWAARINANNTIEFKNLYNQINNSQYIYRQGPNYTNNAYFGFGGFREIFRGVYSGQLLGKHKLFDGKTNVSWVVNAGKSFRDLPDNRRYRVNIDQSNGSERLFIPSVSSPNYLGRFYSNMDEHSVGGSVNIDHTIEVTENFLPVLAAGVFVERKERDFDARNMGYIKGSNYDPNAGLEDLTIRDLFANPANFGTTGLVLSEQTNGSDSYSASNHLVAYYGSLTLPFGKKVTLSGGARIENNKQDLQSAYINGDEVAPLKRVVRVLPSANLSYNISDKMIVRTTYGQTLNRPEFRELAPFGYYDFEYNWVTVGNPQLKTAQIHNYDVRWELYPSKTEMITVGAFYKKFTNAIEVYNELSGSETKTLSYKNANSADAYGVEIDVRKSLAGLTGSKFVDNLNILFNTSLVKSRVQVEDQPERPLMGQSPYVINAGVYYNNDNAGLQVAILYNVVGKRIFAVGNYNASSGIVSDPDIYELPRNVLDFSITKKFSERMTAKFAISDILNQRYTLLQDGNNDGEFSRSKDQIIQNNRFGSLYTFGLTYKVWQK